MLCKNSHGNNIPKYIPIIKSDIKFWRADIMTIVLLIYRTHPLFHSLQVVETRLIAEHAAARLPMRKLVMVLAQHEQRLRVDEVADSLSWIA